MNGVTNPGYTYDANGNLTAGAGRTVAVTAFNMTASVVQGTTALCLTYDDGHNRVEMDARSSSCAGTLSSATVYLNDPVSGAMGEAVTSGGATTWHDFIAAGGAIVAERFCTGSTPCSSGATWSYVVSDHLGSASVLTNASGTVTERDSYDAWGRRRNADGTDNSACSIASATTRGYTGHEMLDSVCEINANARIYDPTIGRFMSADSMIPDPFNSQSLNRYSYVNNGPLSATDPTGHQSAPRIHYDGPAGGSNDFGDKELDPYAVDGYNPDSSHSSGSSSDGSDGDGQWTVTRGNGTQQTYTSLSDLAQALQDIASGNAQKRRDNAGAVRDAGPRRHDQLRRG